MTKIDSRTQILSFLMLVSVLAISQPSGASEPDFLLADKVVTASNANLQAVPYAISEELLTLCSARSRDLICPTQEDIGAFLEQTGEDRVYLKAVEKYAEADAITAILSSQDRPVTEETHVGSNVAVNPTQYAYEMFQGDIEENLKHYKSSQEVMARLIQGLYELNLEGTSGHEFQLTPEREVFLAGFKLPNGRELFASSLDRVRIGRDLKEKVGKYKFLIDESEWAASDKSYSWKSKNVEMMNTFFLLTALKREAEYELHNYVVAN